MQDYPVSVEIPVQWGELDALGHVNHTRFLVWMETARMSLFEQVGLAWENQPEMGPILAQLEVDYRAPIHFPSTVKSAVCVARIGRTSFVLEYMLTDVKAPDMPVCTGRTVIVLYDYQRGTSVEIPDGLREELTQRMVSVGCGE